MNDPKDIKNSIDKILEVDTELIKKNKILTKKQQNFNIMVKSISLIHDRTNTLIENFGIDLSEYDAPIIELLNAMLEMLYGETGKEIIYFYVFERLNSDGTVNPLKDKTGNPIFLNNENDLWFLINNLKNK